MTIKLIPAVLTLTCSFFLVVSVPAQAVDAKLDSRGWIQLFNGKDLSGWVNANCAPETWSIKDGVIRCTGIPTGAMRTEKQYENFVLEMDWMRRTLTLRRSNATRRKMIS